LKERSHGTADGGPVTECDPGIKAEAYTTVRRKWEQAGLWLDDWGFLPARTWLCEQDLDELINKLDPQPNPGRKLHTVCKTPAAGRDPPASRMRVLGGLEVNAWGNYNYSRCPEI
jgi:hypothetical protein